MFPRFNQGILKLIPKKVDCRQIQDWYPIAMLYMVYKLLAKLMATHLGCLLSNLIKERQPGFI